MGDPIAALLGAELWAGEIRGPAKEREDEYVRRARWFGAFSRHALAFPARLQDPRIFFALRGEADPRELARRAA